MEPKVSVIIPVYNVEKYLGECLNTVLGQTLKEIEVICVDDGSTDRSLDLLREFAQKDSRVRVLTQPNSGSGAARNNAIRHAQGQFIAFMDADDWYPRETTLERLYQCATQNGVLVAGGSIASVNERGDVFEMYTGALAGNRFTKSGVMSYQDYQYDYGYHRFLYHRQMIVDNHIQFPDYRRYQDPPFFIRAMICAGKFYALAEVTYLYRSQPGHVTWKKANLVGLMDGLMAELALSKQAGLAQLHKLCVQRCENDFFDVLSDLSLLDGDLIEKLEALNREVDRNLAGLPADYVIRPLQVLPKREYVTQQCQRPKVSVLMPSLNVGKYIGECLLSVVNQTLKDIEILCIDAGSTDGTLEKLENFAQRDARIRIIHSDRKSYGYQMNLGVDAARGEYIGIVETDDWIEPTMFETMYQAAKQNSADMVKCNYHWFTTGQGRQSLPFENLEKCQYGKVFCPRTDDPTIFTTTPAIWSGIYRKDMITGHHIRFHETPGASFQDTSFHFMVCTVAQRCLLLDQYLHHYRKDNDGSSVHSKGKVFCVSDEMHYYEQFLDQNPQYKGQMYPFYLALKYEKYRWNYSRLMPENQWEFLYLMYTEFLAEWQQGRLDRTQFQPEAWDQVECLVASPVRYYRNTCKVYSARPDFSQVFHEQVLVESQGKDPKVSVIIPIYNTEDYIAQTLDSVLNQTLREVEVVCVNDGSTDRTMDILTQYAQRDSRITLISQVNQGQSAARNAALRHAKGEYVVFLDSDDMLDLNGTQLLYQRASRDQLDVLYYDGTSVYETEELKKNHPYYLTAYEYDAQVPQVLTGQALFQMMKADKKYRVSPCLGLYRLSFLKEHQVTFKEGIVHEDNLFSLVTILSAQRVSHVTDQILIRRVREGSTMTVQKNFMHLYGYMVCLREMAGFLRQLPYSQDLYLDVASELDNIMRCMRSDFKSIADQSACRSKFSPVEQLMLDNILFGNRGGVSYDREASLIRESWTYRIGSFFTFIPRKIRGGIRCYRENGKDYTINRLKEKFAHLFGR